MVSSLVVAFSGALILICALAIFVRVCERLDRASDSDDLREVLLQNGGRVIKYRLEAASRDAEAGFNKCQFCGFENFKRTPFCNVCGTKVREYESHLDAHTAPPHWSTLSLRQKRARLRKEWLRKIDVDGRVYWYRSSRSKTTRTATPRLPGFTLHFVKSLSASMLPASLRTTQDHEEAQVQVSKVTIEIIPPDTEQPGSSDSLSAEARQAVFEAELELPKALKKDVVVETLGVEAALQVLQLIDSSASDASLPPLKTTSNGKNGDSEDTNSTSAPGIKNKRWKQALLPSVQPFPTKYSYFVSCATELLVYATEQYVMLTIRRDSLLADSMEALSVIPRASIRSVMRIDFAGDQGVDAGGLHREWLMILNQELANPANGVFECIDMAEQIFYLNPNSFYDIGEDHLMYYFATGRLVGRSLLEGQVLNFHLALPLLKIILGMPVSLSDLEYFDPEAFKSLMWINENDGVGDLGITFSIAEKRGEEMVVVVDLIENGRNIDVTDKNKDLYLERRFRYLLFESVSSQLYAFLKGLYEVIPHELLMVFDPEELDYVLCGSDEIDVDQWERHTIVSATLKRNPRVIEWFWELVREMPNELRRRLLHFATGSSRIPLGGFGALTSNDGRLCLFTLKGVRLAGNEYISSRACFNRLDIPIYKSKDQMATVLLGILEIEEFGFTKD
ncbi:Hect e3 ubiquitin [Globisporangium polare]